MRTAKPPLGVMPYWLSDEGFHGTLAELLRRYVAVDSAVQRYRAAGRQPPVAWLVELGVADSDAGIPGPS
jgi:hypothetical protein